MKKIKGLLGLVLVAAILGGGGYWVWSALEEEAPKDELVIFGNVDIRQVELAFNGSERIEEMLVEEGDRVRQGQLLAVLETDRLKYAVDRAEAQVEAQKQVVARLEAGTRPEEIRKARAEVEAAEATHFNAKRNYQRFLSLAAQNAISQEKLDDSKAALETTEARLKAAREALDLAVAGPRKEDIAEAKARLKAFEAELALVKQQLADAKLYAPANGIVQNRILEPGDMASPQKPAYTIALTDPIWVRAYISETDLGKISPGMEASITTDSYPGKKYEGWIGYISPTAEFTPKSVETREVRTKLVYQVRVYARNPRNELRLGMPATVEIAF